ncbi:jerky protein homolog-like [Suncus etruscus]|uniref:jerky protein homolog-like n=1 Tax=Suncus etruscus TaxID=109475 RepID=UPI0021101BBF|nr:jerky protein homolog-like [Suncus etruscus]
MAGKRKRVVLTIKDKLDILRQLEAGGSSRQLAGAYGIGETTVRDIRKNKERLLRYASGSDSAGLLARRKSMKPSMYEALDRAMLQWFRQQRARGQPVSGPLCAKRAEFFFYALGLDGDFHPSAGWLTRFKQRHSLRGLGAGPRARDHPDPCGGLRDFLRREGLQPEQVYGAHDAGLFWRCPPRAQPGPGPGPAPAPAPAPRRPGERVSLLCCANATGAHKLKPCVVGRARPPRAFPAADTANLPVSYLSQRRACLDPATFRRWFHRAFVPQVREHLRAKGLRPKAVLLLRGAPAHPGDDALRSDDGQVVAKHLPPDAAALLQPAHQAVVAALRRRYRQGLLQANLDEGDDLRAFWARLTLLDALYEIAASWNSVKPATISRAWKKVLPALDDKEGPDPGAEDSSAAAVASLAQRTKGLESVTADGIERWLDVDSAEPGYEVLSDREIIRRAQGQTDESSDNEDEDRELVPETQIDHAAALQWTENLLAYLEQQGDMILPDRLVIRKLRATIRNKQKMSNSSQ